MTMLDANVQSSGIAARDVGKGLDSRVGLTVLLISGLCGKRRGSWGLSVAPLSQSSFCVRSLQSSRGLCVCGGCAGLSRSLGSFLRCSCRDGGSLAGLTSSHRLLVLWSSQPLHDCRHPHGFLKRKRDSVTGQKENLHVP